MLKIIGLLLLFITSSSSSDEGFKYIPLNATYELIGKVADSDKTYSGRVKITDDGKVVKMERTINGIKTIVNGRIVKIADENIVLRMDLKFGKEKMYSTCLLKSDLDNYARITCRAYNYNMKTEVPGMEALFLAGGSLYEASLPERDLDGNPNKYELEERQFLIDNFGK
jgi:hypothetical protein